MEVMCDIRRKVGHTCFLPLAPVTEWRGCVFVLISSLRGLTDHIQRPKLASYALLLEMMAMEVMCDITRKVRRICSLSLASVTDREDGFLFLFSSLSGGIHNPASLTDQ